MGFTWCACCIAWVGVVIGVLSEVFGLLGRHFTSARKPLALVVG